MRRNRRERVDREESVGLPDDENGEEGAREVLSRPSNQLSSTARKAKKKLTVKKDSDFDADPRIDFDSIEAGDSKIQSVVRHPRQEDPVAH